MRGAHRQALAESVQVKSRLTMFVPPCRLAATVLEDPAVLLRGSSDLLDDFNLRWVATWTQTRNYNLWRR